MKLNRLIAAAAIVLAGAFCTAQAAPTMAKHMQKGVTCEQCHNSSAPTAAAKSKACMKCHNYQDLAAASAAKKVALNPHDSHAGHYYIPVDDAPQFVHMVGTAVLVIKIVGMFPHVESE